MKKPFSSACCWVTVALAATILSGCVHSYPPPTFKLDVTYPLQPCTPEKVNAAASQVTLREGGLKHDNDTVCRTALAGDPAPAPTPVADGTKIPDAACSEPAIDETTRANESQKDRARRLEQQAFTRQERCLRERLEAPFAVAARAGKRFGIALSGGGSKASAFGIGVLAGLSDLGLLDRADYVSSVSGGSYAAYFYYAHRIFPLVRNDRRRTLPSNEELFRDCVAIAGRGHEEVGRSDLEQHAEIKLINNIRRSVPYCNLYELPTYRWDPAQKKRIDVPPGRYQTLLKCMQDLLRPGDCTMLPTSVRRSGVSAAMVVGSLVTVPLAFVSNSLFDWGLATSPSGISYEDGIGLAHGATLTDTSELSELTVTRRLRNCGPQDSGEYLLLDCRQDVLDPDPEPMTFDELRVGMLNARKHGDDGLPFWILNAVAPEYRSLYGWMRRGAKHTSDSDMFEMTAVSHGSGRFGYVSASPAIHDMDVLDAVRASAAFFDANQLVYTNRFKRTGIGLFLHLANLDWGLDIPNYNVSTTRRTVHRFLPFPLYYLDGLATRVGLSGKENAAQRERESSSFIRLIDGGNAENLGLYSLLKRGVRNVLVADAAADPKGRFDDLCSVRRRLNELRSSGAHTGTTPTYLYLPGLDKFEEHCKALDEEREQPGYNLYKWYMEHPLLLGCIRVDEAPQPEQPCHGLKPQDARLIVAKPALNLESYVKEQLASPIVQTTDAGVPAKLAKCWLRGMGTLPDMINCDTALFLRMNSMHVNDNCPMFPQHATWRITANSSGTVFVAYRELARQHVFKAKELLLALIQNDDSRPFETALTAQRNDARKTEGQVCPQHW